MAHGGPVSHTPGGSSDGNPKSSKEQNEAMFSQYIESGKQKVEQGKDLDAIAEYKKALQYQIYAVGEGDFNVAETQKLIGKLYSKNGMHKDACDMLLTAVSTYEKCSADEKQVWQCHDLLAKCYNKLNDKVREIEHYEKAINLLQHAREGKPIERLALMHNNVANAYKKLADQNKADENTGKVREHLEEAKNVMKQLHREESKSMVQIHLSLGQTYKDLNQNKLAIEEFESSIRVSSNTHPELKEEFRRKTARQKLVALYESDGETAKAEEHKKMLRRFSNRSSSGAGKLPSQHAPLTEEDRDSVVGSRDESGNLSLTLSGGHLSSDSETDVKKHSVQSEGKDQLYETDEVPGSDSKSHSLIGYLTANPPSTDSQNTTDRSKRNPIVQNESGGFGGTGVGYTAHDSHLSSHPSAMPSLPLTNITDRSEHNPIVQDESGGFGDTGVGFSAHDSHLSSSSSFPSREGDASRDGQSLDITSLNTGTSSGFDSRHPCSSEVIPSLPLTNLTDRSEHNSIVQTESGGFGDTGVGYSAHDSHSSSSFPSHEGDASKDGQSLDIASLNTDSLEHSRSLPSNLAGSGNFEQDQPSLPVVGVLTEEPTSSGPMKPPFKKYLSHPPEGPSSGVDRRQPQQGLEESLSSTQNVADDFSSSFHHSNPSTQSGSHSGSFRDTQTVFAQPHQQQGMGNIIQEATKPSGASLEPIPEVVYESLGKSKKYHNEPVGPTTDAEKAGSQLKNIYIESTVQGSDKKLDQTPLNLPVPEALMDHHGTEAGQAPSPTIPPAAQIDDQAMGAEQTPSTLNSQADGAKQRPVPEPRVEDVSTRPKTTPIRRQASDNSHVSTSGNTTFGTAGGGAFSHGSQGNTLGMNHVEYLRSSRRQPSMFSEMELEKLKRKPDKQKLKNAADHLHMAKSNISEYPEDAVLYSEKVLEICSMLDPSGPEAQEKDLSKELLCASESYYNNQQYDSALEYVQSLERLRPTNPEDFTSMLKLKAKILDALGKKVEARECIDRLSNFRQHT